MFNASIRYWEPFGIFFLLNERQLAGIWLVKIILDVFELLSIVIAI